MTGVSDLQFPQHVKVTPELLGIGQNDLRVLRIPDGLEIVGDRWFTCSNMEKVIIPSSVRTLGDNAFSFCRKLREVVFEPVSQLECIERGCFNGSLLAEIVIPKSVREIGERAFGFCQDLSSLIFEEGSQLNHVGKNAILGTLLN